MVCLLSPVALIEPEWRLASSNKYRRVPATRIRQRDSKIIWRSPIWDIYQSPSLTITTWCCSQESKGKINDSCTNWEKRTNRRGIQTSSNETRVLWERKKEENRTNIEMLDGNQSGGYRNGNRRVALHYWLDIRVGTINCGRCQKLDQNSQSQGVKTRQKKNRAAVCPLRRKNNNLNISQVCGKLTATGFKR